MNNKLEDRLANAKKELSSRRGTGRTTKMLVGVIEDAIKTGKPGDYYLVISHTPNWGKDMMEMTIKKLNEIGLEGIIKPGNVVEIKGSASVLFRTEEWWDQPRNRRSFKPKGVYYDNVFSDLSLEKHIRYLENEINPMPIRERSRTEKQASEYLKAQLDWASGKRQL